MDAHRGKQPSTSHTSHAPARSTKEQFPTLSSHSSAPLGHFRNARDSQPHSRHGPSSATCGIDWNQVPRELRSSAVLKERFDLQNDRDWDTLEQNLHVLQNPSILPCIERILKEEAPGEPYRRRKGECKTVLHWGQRKLLFSEIEFLTLFAEPNITVVYAGAAPGKHMNFLSKLFPDVTFVLVDPNRFSCEETEKISLRVEFFTDELAREYANRKTLFISDIRTADPSVLSHDDVEEYVKSDMDAQQRWHLIMNPKRSMLKFRLPWGGGKTKYLAGDVYLPIWGPQTTSETRLIVGGKELKDWDNTLYENQMFYFNTHTRVQCYDHDINLPESAEIHVLREYLVKFQDRWWPEWCMQHKIDPSSSPSPAHYSRRIVEMSKAISWEITRGGRNLSHPQPPPEHRGKMGHVKFHEILPRTGYLGTGVLESGSLQAVHSPRPRRTQSVSTSTYPPTASSAFLGQCKLSVETDQMDSATAQKKPRLANAPDARIESSHGHLTVASLGPASMSSVESYVGSCSQSSSLSSLLTKRKRDGNEADVSSSNSVSDQDPAPKRQVNTANTAV